MSIIEISSKDSWQILENDKNAILIDVRTNEELNSVGFPDLSSINNAHSINIAWRLLPNMDLNKSFTEELPRQISRVLPKSNSKEVKLLFLCRSGVRSFEAATLMSDFGYDCYNIINGFEGKSSNEDTPNSINSWKAENLPRRQN